MFSKGKGSKSAWGTTTKAGMAMKEMSGMNRKGPSSKNTNATRKSRPNPSGMLNSVVGKTHTGPDMGNG